MISFPVHIEVKDESPRRADANNDVSITIFDQRVGGDKRLPLFTFKCDRRALLTALENDYSCNRLELSTLNGTMPSSS